MHTRIQPRRLLNEQEEREIKAALALAGMDQKAFARRRGISYGRLNRMITRMEVVTPEYARILNALLRSTLGRYATAA